jgi:Leucine-rich repeat (LRR) protein
VADVDPQFQGELSTAAIAAAAHETDASKIYELKLRGAGIEKIENLVPLRKLRHLDLSGNQIARVEGLDKLADLRELKLFANQLAAIEGLDGCANLRLLSLQHNRITRIDGLQKLTKLQQLRLDSNLIEKIENLGPNTALTHLNLSGNQIQRVEGMLSLALLEELLLNDNEIVAVAKVPGRSLVELSLAGNRLGEPFEDPMPGAKARSCLAGLAAAKKLTALDLSANQLSGELGSQLPKMLSLESLNLDSNKLDALGAMAELCPALELLELRSNEILDPRLGGTLPEGVTELAVSSNPLTHSDTWRVDVCRSFPSLEQLDEALAEHGAAGAAGGVGARPGTAGARGAGNAPVMRPPSAKTEALSTLIAPEALETTAAGLSARLAALKLTLSAGDTPRAWVNTLPKNSTVAAAAAAAAAAPAEGAVAIQQPPAAVTAAAAAAAAAAGSRQHEEEPSAAAAAPQISGAALKAQLLGGGGDGPTAAAAGAGAAAARPSSGGRSAGRGLSAALDYSRYAHGGDTDSDDDEDGCGIFAQIDTTDPAKARAAAKKAITELRGREDELLKPTTAVERRERRRGAREGGGEGGGEGEGEGEGGGSARAMTPSEDGGIE